MRSLAPGTNAVSKQLSEPAGEERRDLRSTRFGDVVCGNGRKLGRLPYQGRLGLLRGGYLRC
jgi:hypothetical protein